MADSNKPGGNNPDGNPNIAKHGELTRFGTNNQPKMRSKPWSIKKALRRIGAGQLDITIDQDGRPRMENLDALMIAKMVGSHRSLSPSELMAARMFKDGLNGVTKAQVAVMEAIDGKAVNKTVEARVTLAELLTGDFKEDDDDE